MKRFAVIGLVLVGLLSTAPLAQASDAGLKHALKPYTARLTADIGYLANFSAPSKSRVSAARARLSKIHRDLTGARHAALGQQGSTNSGRKARTLVLEALHDALVATADARTCASAVSAGKSAAAKLDAKHVLSETNKAIPLFETAGHLLHLF